MTLTYLSARQLQFNSTTDTLPSTLEAGWVAIDTTTTEQFYWDGTLWTRIAPVNSKRKYGTFQGISSAAGNVGLAVGAFNNTTGEVTRVVDTAGVRDTWTTAASNPASAGFRSGVNTERSQNPYLRVRFTLSSLTAVRAWFGFQTLASLPTGADALANVSGAMIHLVSGGTNWQIMTNNGGASSTIATTGVPASTDITIVEIRAIDASTKFQWRITADGVNPGAWTDVSTTIPAQGTDMAIGIAIETTETVAKTLALYSWTWLQDK
jgi:hypothetical protein